ncbi:hypothetical protein [Moorena sp. SIO3H5]|nr:hypothetical protein [Moorena sp. SIO3H5]
MQRGLGKAARSWGFPPLAIAVVSPMSDCIKTMFEKTSAQEFIYL